MTGSLVWMCFVPRNQCGMVWEFGYLDVSNLQNKWIHFVGAGSSKLDTPPDWSVFVCFCSLFIITGSWFFENLVPAGILRPADAEDLLHPDGWRETAESEKKSEQLGKYVGFVFSHFLIDWFFVLIDHCYDISLPCHQGDRSLAVHEKSASNLQ